MVFVLSFFFLLVPKKTGDLIISLADPPVSRLEVLHQIEQWGEVEDSHDVDHCDIRARLGSAAILYRFSSPEAMHH